jgi:leucyl/phenylalanyl-tRNA--protein transferase
LELTPEKIEWAYAQGAFPMGMEDGSIGWFRPDPRAIIPVDSFHASHSLRKSAGKYRLTLDRAYEKVMRACARPETWITEEFVRVYGVLFQMGKGHSAEAWLGDELVGGVYGVSMGRAFMAESMFHTSTDAGKAALWHLVSSLREAGCTLFDVQFLTPHLASLGAVEIPLSQYLRRLEEAMGETLHDF